MASEDSNKQANPSLDKKEEQLDNFFADLTESNKPAPKPPKPPKTPPKKPAPPRNTKPIEESEKDNNRWWLWLLGVLLAVAATLYFSGVLGWFNQQVLGPDLKTAIIENNVDSLVDTSPTEKPTTDTEFKQPVVKTTDTESKQPVAKTTDTESKPPVAKTTDSLVKVKTPTVAAVKTKPTAGATAQKTLKPYLVQVAACLSQSCVNSVKNQLKNSSLPSTLRSYKKNQPIVSLISLEVFKDPVATISLLKNTVPKQYSTSPHKVGQAFRILVSGFENPVTAKNWTKNLEAKHDLHFERMTKLQSQNFTRVMVGPFNSKPKAQSAIADLKKIGFTTAFLKFQP